MSNHIEVTTQEMLRRVDDGWNKFQSYLNRLTDEQMTTLTDENGWTVKDHLSHLAVWEDGIAALLEKQSRRERMNLDEVTYQTHDLDVMNSMIRIHHEHKSLAEVRQLFADVHQRLTDAIRKLSDAELVLPYSAFDKSSNVDAPVFGYVVGNSFGHYEEHQEWIQQIVSPLS
jgi:hypothetical protein